MMSTIFAFVFIFVIFGAIYFSGVYAARESVRAIEERDLEGGEWAIALIPFLNFFDNLILAKNPSRITFLFKCSS